MRIQNAKLRTFCPTDVDGLVRLWNRAYAAYAGYVKRTPEHWTWSILQRPGMSHEDIFVLESPEGILGYGVLGPNGKVLELAVDPLLSRRQRTKSTTALTRAIEERCQMRGDEILDFVVPHTDYVVCQALRSAGYREERADCLNMTIVNLELLISKVLVHRKLWIPSDWHRSFLFELKPGQYRFSAYKRLLIRLGEKPGVDADPQVHSADYIVDTDLSTLTDLIFGRSDFQKAIANRTIIITPSSGVVDLGRLFDLMKLRTPWCSPSADGR